jgi:hypothetical protein
MELLDSDGQMLQNSYRDGSASLLPRWLVEGQVLTKADGIRTSSSFEMIDLETLASDSKGRIGLVGLDLRCFVCVVGVV